MSSLTVPPKLAANPSIRRITEALAATRTKNRALREEASQAQTPIEQTGAIQGGAAAAAAIEVYGGGESAALKQLFASGLALAYGLVKGQPMAVSFANGLLAPLVYAKTKELLQKQRAKE